jgi:hypothetical protein
MQPLPVLVTFVENNHAIKGAAQRILRCMVCTDILHLLIVQDGSIWICPAHLLERE